MFRLSTSSLSTFSFQINIDKTSDIFSIQESMVDARSSIFVSKSSKGNKLATKVFVHQDYLPCIYYLNESRFSSLRHPNVISIHHTIDKLEVPMSGQSSVSCSLIFMELAVCDMKDLITSFKFDEKMARTFFHQLVDGLSYVHSKGVAHMDLKLENLLLGADLKVKLADFDFAYKEGDIIIQGYGSQNFRAPEVIERKCRNPQKADIFSLGVILFCFVLGHVPFSEDDKVRDYDLQTLMMDDPQNYWRALRDIKGALPVCDDFMDLFMSMVCRDPAKRATFKDIKQSRWFKKATYSQKEMESLLKLKLPKNYLNL